MTMSNQYHTTIRSVVVLAVASEKNTPVSKTQVVYGGKTPWGDEHSMY